MKDQLRKYLNSKAFWSFLDQCIVSGSTLVVSVLLVSYLGLDLFGVYSIYWMAVLLISGFHQALVVMPLYTLHAKTDNFEAYLGALLKEQIRFSLLSILTIFLVFASISFVGYQVNLFHGFLMGLITATFTLQDFLRRILFVQARATQVVIIDLISVGVLPLILASFWTFHTLDLSTVLLVVLFLKVVSIVIALWIISPVISWSKSSGNIRKQHWESGKFLLASSVLQWFSGNAFVLVSGMLLGPASIGVLRIAQSILGVINVFFLFLENRIPIEAARILHNNGTGAFTKYMLQESKRYFLLLIVSLVCLALCQEMITEVFFGDAMKNYPWLIPAYCLLYVFIYAGTMLRFTFRTLDQNNILFYGYVISAIVGLSSVYPMIKWCGISGAVLGLFATQIATIATYTYFLKQQL